MISRRGFLGAIIATATAPAIVSASSLMPVRSIDRRIILPMVRTIHPHILASDLVNVQPMTGPVGEIFTMWNDPMVHVWTIEAMDEFKRQHGNCNLGIEVVRENINVPSYRY